MKVALIGNLGGNQELLTMILHQAKKRDVDEIWNIGNILGPDINFNHTVQLLKKEKVLGILGEYDIKVLKAKLRLNQLKKGVYPDDILTHYWINQNITDNNLKFLKTLPKELKFKAENKKILLTQQIYSKNGPSLLPQNNQKNDIIIYSDPKSPSLAYKINGVWVINTSGINLQTPTMDSTTASYGILQFKQGFFRVLFYPLSSYIKKFDVEPTAGLGYSLLENNHDFRINLKSIANFTHLCLAGRKKILVHSYQVQNLALKIFDLLQPLHQLGSKERFLLQSGALLHDIGWITGREGHHKTAYHMIKNSGSLAISDEDRHLLSELVKHHRNKPLKINPESRAHQTMAILVAILKIADGLDYSHRSLVKDIQLMIEPHVLKFSVATQDSSDTDDYQRALHKGIFLGQIFQRKLVIEWNSPQDQ